MKLNELKAPSGSTKNSIRKGRGHATGRGKTAGRGHGGQNSRSGGGVRIGFEGGQMPLYRRIPKRGFNNKNFAKVFVTVNVSELEMFNDDTVVDQAKLIEAGLVNKVYDGVKILGDGEITKKLNVKATKFSAGAIQKIEAMGGKAEVV